MIALENINFSYGPLSFIQDLSLAIHPGKVTGLIGPNGSGKSTILKLAAGILHPQQGSVLLGGRDIKTIHPRNRAKQVSLLRQGGRIPPLQAWEVVLSARYPYRGPWSGYSATDREAVRLAMEDTGCANLADRRMDRLSGGERQKVSMAAALAQQTQILLLDEPTSYQDVGSSISWMRFVREMNHSHNKTVAVVLHDLNLALQFCDTIILINQGAVIWEGAPEKLAESDMLSKVFHITVRAFDKDGRRFYCFE